MATQRIESGQMQLRSVGGVPMVQAQQQQVDFIAPRVAAQGASQLAQILDRMSANAFQTAAALRQDEGLQYAADNRLTDEQLKLAKDGVDIGLPGTNSLSYFDQAVAKARSLELSSHFEEEGKNVLVKLLNDVEAGNASAADVGDKIKSATDGLATALAKNNFPEASIKFRATMATHGNTVLNAAYKAESQRKKAQDIALFDAGFKNEMRLLGQRLKDGFWKDPAGNIRSIDDLVSVSRSNVLTKSLLLGDQSLQSEYAKKFEDELSAAKIDVVSEHVVDTGFAANPMSAIAKLDRGDAGKLTPIWDMMSFSDKAKVRSNLRTVQIERQTTSELNEKENIKADSLRSAELQSQFFQTGNKKLLEELQVISIRSPSVISPETVFELPGKLVKDTPPNEAAEYVLKNEIIKGLHPNEDAVGKRAKQLGINYKQINNSIMPFFLSRDSKDEAATFKRFALESKIVPGTTNLGPKQSAALLTLIKNFESEYAEQTKAAIAKGLPPPTRRSVEDQVIERRNSSAQTKAINQLVDNLNKQYGPSGTLRKTGIVFTEDTSIEDIAARAKQLNLNNEDVNSIRNSLRLINQKSQERDSQ
jgi:hypothetical protein